MALFKVYHGDKDNLPGELKDSYGYITVNEEVNAGTWIDDNSEEQEYGIGEWYIDTSTKRYRIAAAQLVDEEGNHYSLDDIVQKEDIVDDLIGAVYNSSTQQSKLLPSAQEELRISISAPKEEDAITKAYSITVPSSQWTQDSERTGYYKKEITLPETLHCGSLDATVRVPPMITWSGVGSKTIYDLFSDVKLNDAKNVLTFYVTSADYPSVTSNVGVIVIDHR